MKECLVKIWGGFTNEDSPVPQEIKELEGGHYFKDEEEVNIFLNKFKPYKKYGFANTLDNSEEFTHKRTVADLTFSYENKIYKFYYDFGLEYPEESAHWMFKEGNYSCDCNRSIFINRYCDDNFEELDCGHVIKLEEMIIRLEN